jgi:hypothetical protein
VLSNLAPFRLPLIAQLILRRFTVWCSSVELLRSLQELQNNCSIAIAQGRRQVQDIVHAHAHAKMAWLREKKAHDLQRASTVLPFKLGLTPEGTDKIMTYMRENHSPVSQQVAQCLSDVVDGCVAISEGKVLPQKFKDFVPPGDASKDPREAQERQIRIENDYKNKYENLNRQYQQNEMSRSRAWRKLMQTKASVEAHQDLWDIRHGDFSRRARVTSANHTHFPVPPLHQSRREPLPQQTVQRSSFATYNPPPPTSRHISTSKYSAARIRERIAADGTVAPVSEAKRDKDGLYVRPSGRTRKGMKWDAVNGVWIPDRED